MYYNLKPFLKRLRGQNITYDTSKSGQFKGDHYVTHGSATPHIHIASNGNFVGLKNKQGAIKGLVIKGQPKIDTIDEAIAELAGATSTSEVAVLNALTQLRQHAATGA
jgi:hypothetical protein